MFTLATFEIVKYKTIKREICLFFFYNEITNDLLGKQCDFSYAIFKRTSSVRGESKKEKKNAMNNFE